jgi:hypothetical protein
MGKFAWFGMAFSLVILLFVGSAAGGKDEDENESECDLAKVVKMHYCELDEIILEKKQLVSDKKYYVCEDCKEVGEKKGECVHCEGKVVEKVSGKNVCPTCYGEVIEAEVCIKEYWECPDCEEGFAKAGKCAECEKDLVKKTSRAVVEYWCEECAHSARKPGTCPNKECKAKGKKLTRSCEMSGEFPHVAAPKK